MESDTTSRISIRDCDLFTRLVRVRPLFSAAVLFLIGCILQRAMAFAPLALLVALATLLLAAICLRGRRNVAVALLVLAMLPAGALRFGIAWSATEPLPEQRDVLLAGRIAEVPDFHTATQRTVCVLEEFSIDGAPQSGKLRLYLRGDEALLQEVQLGQRVELTANVWQADAATNPGQFDNAYYQRSLGLRNYATAEIESAAFSEPELRFTDFPKQLRIAAGARIDQLFPKNTAIARALILGDRSGLSSEERANYARAGAAHLLAISGMHMSILAAALALALRHFHSRAIVFWPTLMLLSAYGVLVGFIPSLSRALIMFAILGMAPLSGRYSDPFTRLGAAVLLYLMIRPAAILDVGFVLSYSATAGILFLVDPMARLPLIWRIKDEHADIGKLPRKPLRWFVDMLLMTTAAQLAVLPAVAHYFGAQPVWSLFTNLLAVPLTMIGYIVALAAFLLNFAPLAGLADLLFTLLTRIVTGIASLPLAELRFARFPLWLVLLCVLVCFASSDLTRLPQKLRRFLPFAILLAIPVANLCSWGASLGMSVVFLDAGQADCAVIRSEGSIYLVDTGDVYSPAADYLSAMNYAPDAIFLTHPHVDHAGGLAEILESTPPKRIYISPNWADYEAAPEIDAALDAARNLGIEIATVAAGDEIALSANAVLHVLSPKAGISASSANDDSLVLRLEYGSASALFLADASAELSAGLVSDIDLLKVAHHGAKNGTDAQLLAAASPSAAVISVGRDNSYGHPALQVLRMLESIDVQIYRTDLFGAITCRMYRDGTLKLRGFQNSEDS